MFYLPFALLLQASPTPPQFVEALSVVVGRPVAVQDVRRLDCRASGKRPGEVDCTWQWRQDGSWRRYAISALLDSHNWLLIDAPAPKE